MVLKEEFAGLVEAAACGTGMQLYLKMRGYSSTVLTGPNASTLLSSTSLRDSEQRRTVGVPEQESREQNSRESPPL